MQIDMSNNEVTLSQEAALLMRTLSGAYCAPFWDGLYEVTGNIEVIEGVRAALDALHMAKKDLEAFKLLLSLYDLAALDLPGDVADLEVYPENVQVFIREFLLDTEDLIYDFRDDLCI